MLEHEKLIGIEYNVIFNASLKLGDRYPNAFYVIYKTYVNALTLRHLWVLRKVTGYNVDKWLKLPTGSGVDVTGPGSGSGDDVGTLNNS